MGCKEVKVTQLCLQEAFHAAHLHPLTPGLKIALLFPTHPLYLSILQLKNLPPPPPPPFRMKTKFHMSTALLLTILSHTHCRDLLLHWTVCSLKAPQCLATPSLHTFHPLAATFSHSLSPLTPPTHHSRLS